MIGDISPAAQCRCSRPSCALSSWPGAGGGWVARITRPRFSCLNKKNGSSHEALQSEDGQRQ